jgi:hypothetical protein
MFGIERNCRTVSRNHESCMSMMQIPISERERERERERKRIRRNIWRGKFGACR